MKRTEPGPGQESVWDYPRPPRVERTTSLIRVVFNDVEIARTAQAYRVLETSHPPAIYIPPADVQMQYLQPSPRHTFCEFKGQASYWSLNVNGRTSRDAAWSYPHPRPGFEAIRDCLAFYASRVDACYVDDEQVVAQEGDFYGGWITSTIVGPFKGGPGTWGW
jgi:uncharacterized protein (DUF427 family)